MKEFLIGDTIKATWINSGASPTAVDHTLYSGSETAVSTVTLTDSGNGHFWGYITLPETPGFYVSETIATISSLPFKRRVRLRAKTGEAD